MRSCLFALRSQDLENTKLNQRKLTNTKFSQRKRRLFLNLQILASMHYITSSLLPILRENSYSSSFFLREEKCGGFFSLSQLQIHFDFNFLEPHARSPASWVQSHHLMTVHRYDTVGLVLTSEGAPFCNSHNDVTEASNCPSALIPS